MCVEISENGVNKGVAYRRAVLQRAPCAQRSPLYSYVLLGDCKEGTKIRSRPADISAGSPKRSPYISPTIWRA